MRGGLLCQAGRSNDLHKAHPIKGVGGEVEDHSKASGLENLCKPNAMKTSFQWLRCSQVYELEVTLGLTR